MFQRVTARAAPALVALALCPFMRCELSAEGRGHQSAPSAPRFKIPRAFVPGFPVPRRDPAKIAVGERLFLETRFSHYFFAHCQGDVNTNLPTGDPVVAASATTGSPLPGPFSGFSINCRACHLVNEHAAAGRGNRTYADYARRSPMPDRADGKARTVRNSPPIVNATIPRESEFFLHYDGEFLSNEDLVKGTLAGRNFGWLPEEHDQAVRHIARVIREDSGEGPLAAEFGGFSYRRMFAGDDPALGEEGERFRLTEEYRLEVDDASDAEILAAVARLISAYMDSLFFSRDESAEYDSSPYDAFLETNQIPRKVEWGQSPVYYNRNVLSVVQNIRDPIFIEPDTNRYRFKTLKQDFRFGAEELRGMKIFFALARDATNSLPVSGGKIGNCVACHLAPDFTDFRFHNTGVTQEEYDSAHGPGAFAKLRIPGLDERNADYEAWLPPTPQHPRARGPFLDIAAAEKPGQTDLGLWNVFANPDQPSNQAALRRLLNSGKRAETDAALLPQTVGLFKTPSLRGLGFSDPYLHNGSKDTLEEVIEFYRRNSALARAGQLRNAAPELLSIYLTKEDVAPLAAFLRSLNEDYE
jgi:cytochrome c peroxidase